MRTLQVVRSLTLQAVLIMLSVALFSVPSTADSAFPAHSSGMLIPSGPTSTYHLEGRTDITMEITGPDSGGVYDVEIKVDGRVHESGTMSWAFGPIFFIEIGSSEGAVIVMPGELSVHMTSGPKAGTKQTWLEVE
ncbi:MAG: hypothetical protein AAGG01_02740 [Planctomycetota bacterium]